MKKDEIDLRLELIGDSFQPGSAIYGHLTISTSSVVKFLSGVLKWQTQETTVDEQNNEKTVAVMTSDQNIPECFESVLEGQIEIPIEFVIPEKVPSSVDALEAQGLRITTSLTITLMLGEPLYASIIREYPIKIIKASDFHGGILQSIEFPVTTCCNNNNIANAHIELLQTCFTADDHLEATVVIDLTQSSADIKSATLLLKRKVIWKEEFSHEVKVDEVEVIEGPKSKRIMAGRKSAITLSTVIPPEGFVPDIETNRIAVKHAALFLFYTKKYTVETEIPICLVHEEALVG